MAAELTACPWCRQVPGPVLFAVANASLSVVCNCCGAHGPYADSEADAASAWSAAAGVQERYDFVLAACRDAQDMASRYAWALREIADMDPTGQRADDFGRATRAARAALLGHGNAGVGVVAPLPGEEFIGWKPVPITPTRAMLDAAYQRFIAAVPSLVGFNARELAYKALLDAAPPYGGKEEPRG